MTEAWEQHLQTVEVEGIVQQLTFMQAAARLGIGVFASAALREGALLEDTALEVQCFFDAVAQPEAYRALLSLLRLRSIICVIRELKLSAAHVTHETYLQARLGKAEELLGIQGYGARLLQISRSTPYLTAALIGHKRVSSAPSEVC